MSIGATTQVLSGSVDSAGISIVTATHDIDNPRLGTAYNPSTLAAGVPVWFHRMQDGRYLSLFTKRWVDATVSNTSAGARWYSTYTPDSTPYWVMIDPITGVTSDPGPIPSRIHSSWNLISAVSYRDYLFVLGHNGPRCFVQHFHMTTRGNWTLQAEENLPISGLTFGLFIDGFNLTVFGCDEEGKLISIRKNWGRIGTSEDSSKQWEYQGVKGWYRTSGDIDPLVTTDGNLIPVYGPVSAAKVRDRMYLSVTTYNNPNWTAKFYTSRAVDLAWTLLDVTIDLGNADTYAGYGVYLQPQLPANTTLYDDGTRAAYPYVMTKLASITAEDEEETVSSSLNTSWGLFQV